VIRVAHVFRELGRNFIRHPLTALVSLLSLTLLFLMFNLFWVTAGTAEQIYRDLLSELRMEVFLSEELPDSSLATVTQDISAVQGIALAEFVDKRQARQRLADRLGVDLLVGYDSVNPLPRSYVVTLEPPALNSAGMQAIEDKLALLPGVVQVEYSRRYIEKAERTRELILQVGLALGGLILLAALANSANNIRLMTRARAVGFRQMMLLGAGRLFVGLPFVIEGFLTAGLAALASWAIVIYGVSKVQFTQFSIIVPTQNEMGLFSLAAAVVGAVSGYVGIRQLLK
jgi:cell division protein FtsX